MKANLDGARKRLVCDFNRLAILEDLTDKQKSILIDMRHTIVGLCLMYDPDNKDDCNEIIDEVTIFVIEDSPPLTTLNGD